MKEDEGIREIISELGDNLNWTKVALYLETKFGIKGRTGKQCRERWHNYLKNPVTKNHFSIEDEKMIFRLHRDFGTKWAEISKNFQGRSDN